MTLIDWSIVRKPSVPCNGRKSTSEKISVDSIQNYAPQLALKLGQLRLQLHGAIYRPDSLVLMLRYCANLKAIRYESTSLNRIVADKSHRVIIA